MKFVAATVGWLDGCPDGLLVGFPEGPRLLLLPNIVGLGLGRDEGITVGEAVGCPLGSLLGCAVGCPEGCDEGELVGDVGPTVGP